MTKEIQKRKITKNLKLLEKKGKLDISCMDVTNLILI